MHIADIDFSVLIKMINAKPYRYSMDGKIYHLYDHAEMEVCYTLSADDSRLVRAILHDLGYRQLLPYSGNPGRVMMSSPLGPPSLFDGQPMLRFFKIT